MTEPAQKRQKTKGGDQAKKPITAEPAVDQAPTATAVRGENDANKADPQAQYDDVTSVKQPKKPLQKGPPSFSFPFFLFVFSIFTLFLFSVFCRESDLSALQGSRVHQQRGPCRGA